MSGAMKSYLLHGAVLLVLFVAQFVVPQYHATNLARIMVLAVFAMGYNIAFGYTGLLSLGHALFFAAGMYGMGLPVWHWGMAGAPAFLLGIAAAGALALAVGMLALRTAGVSFMIVTLMFAQAGHLMVLYYGRETGGDEGFNVAAQARQIFGYNLSTDTPRYIAAFVLFALAMAICLWLARSPFGRVLVAMRENEERSRMLGYNPFTIKLKALILSGMMSGAAGAAYGLLFGYVGGTFSTIQYSILPMLYVLLGGAGTVLGPFFGALVMFYLTDIASSYTDAWLLLVGVALVLVVLFARKGLLGTLRERIMPWLP